MTEGTPEPKTVEELRDQANLKAMKEMSEFIPNNLNMLKVVGQNQLQKEIREVKKIKEKYVMKDFGAILKGDDESQKNGTMPTKEEIDPTNLVLKRQIDEIELL